MTWTYSGNPGASDLDTVRFLIGDTDTTDQLVADAEITWALTQGNIYRAASRVARSIAAKFSRFNDEKVGDLAVFYRRRVRQYSDLADALLADASSFDALPFSAAGSLAIKDAQEDRADRVSPQFTLGQHDARSTVVTPPTLTEPDL